MTDEFVSSLSMNVKHLIGSGQGKDVYFWKFELDLLGQQLPSNRQEIGDCVGHGWARAVQDLILFQSTLTDQLPNPIQVSSEVIYAGSRVEVGGLRGSYSDGSNGAFAAKFINRFGILFRKVYLTHNLTNYSPSRAKEWGAKGVPDELEPLAKANPIREVVHLLTYSEVRDTLANFCPVPVASRQGFQETRNDKGFCKPQGVWPHQLLFRGTLNLRGNLPAIVVQNSWGDYLGRKGEIIYLESGQTLTLPQGAFLIEPETVETMARQGDTYGISSFKGIPKVDLPWIF